MQDSNVVWIDLYVPFANVLMETNPVLMKTMQRYEHVLVDEVQDNDVAQWEFVSTVAKRSQNIFIVGDLDQAIYQFRGADVRLSRLLLLLFSHCRDYGSFSKSRGVI
jgi:DNA helicase II / ATP-dependent DNA helicase PcrA